MKARFCWRGDGLPTVRSCGGDCCLFCSRVRGAGGGEGAVWGNPGGSVGGNIYVQRERRREGGEAHRVVGGDVKEEKKRNGSTNAVVVRAHRGPIRRLNPRNIVVVVKI